MNLRLESNTRDEGEEHGFWHNEAITLFLRLDTRTRKAIWKREVKLPWREAGAPNYHDDKVDLDQKVVKNCLSWTPDRPRRWRGSVGRQPGSTQRKAQ